MPRPSWASHDVGDEDAPSPVRHAHYDRAVSGSVGEGGPPQAPSAPPRPRQELAPKAERYGRKEHAESARTVDTAGSGATFSSPLGGPGPASDEDEEVVQEPEHTPVPEGSADAATSASVSASVKRWLRDAAGKVFTDTPSPVMARLQLLSREMELERAGGMAVDFVDSARGQTLFGIVVLVNAAFIGLDIELTDLYGSQPETMVLIENVFLIVFWAEIFLRMRAVKKEREDECRFMRVVRFFRDRWAPFDVGITLLGSLETWIFEPIYGSAGPLAGASSLRVLRLLRLLRLIRALRSFKELRVVVKTISDGAKAVAMLSILFGGFMYLSSCLVVLSSAGFEEDPEIRMVVGGLLTCMWYHMLLATSEGWVQVWTTPFSRHSSLWTLYFLAVVVILNQLLINMMVGAITQHSLAKHAEEEDEQTNFAYESRQFKQSLLSIIKATDTDGSAGIDADEFRELWRKTDLQAIMKSFGVRVDVPEDFLMSMLGFSEGQQVSYADLTEAAIRMCGSHNDLRAFMLQYEVGAVKQILKRKTLGLRRQLGLDELASPDESDEDEDPYAGLDAEDEAEWDKWISTMEQPADGSNRAPVSSSDRSSGHSGSLRERQPHKIRGHSHFVWSQIRERLRVFEHEQERMMADLAEVGVGLLGTTDSIAVRCKAGHPLIPVGSSEKPLNFAGYRQWACDGSKDKFGCQFGRAPASHLTDACRYHCPQCRYDLCEHCYRGCLERCLLSRSGSAMRDTAVDVD